MAARRMLSAPLSLRPSLKSTKRVEVWAHRGASKDKPENTLGAFAHALDLGAGGVELDVHLSADGRAVVIHDYYLDRTTNGKGPVSAQSLAELQQLNAAARFRPASREREPLPSLKDVLNLVVKERGRRCLVELKGPVLTGALYPLRFLLGSHARAAEAPYYPGLAKAVFEDALEFLEPDVVTREPKIIFQSFYKPYLDELRALEQRQGSKPQKTLRLPRLTLVLLCFTPMGMKAALRPNSGLDGVAVNHRSLSQRRVVKLHAQGILVFAWTVDEEEQLREALHTGIDGVISNVPDLALKVVEELQHSSRQSVISSSSCCFGMCPSRAR